MVEKTSVNVMNSQEKHGSQYVVITHANDQAQVKILWTQVNASSFKKSIILERWKERGMTNSKVEGLNHCDDIHTPLEDLMGQKNLKDKSS